MISIREISDKGKWEQFILEQPNNSFFQSWAWGELQRSLGNKLWRLGLFEKEILTGICQVVKVRAKRGVFLHLRHGPLFSNWQARYFEEFLSYIKNLGRQENAWFIRTSPLLQKTGENVEFFKSLGFQSAPIPCQDAEICWVLDLRGSSDELLSKMRKTTRYLIKKAQRLEVKIVEGTKEADFDIFLKLYQRTAKRQQFVPHQGIKEEWQILSKEKMANLFLAKYKEETLAGAIIVFYGSQAIYHHSGADLRSDIPASYALLWEAVLAAKKEGKDFFNFWGIAPEGNPHHPWRGLTLFKTGFGGNIKEFIHAQDLPLKSLYWFTWVIESIRKIARGY